MPSMSCMCTFIYACTCILAMDIAVILARIAQLDSGRVHDFKKGVLSLIPGFTFFLPWNSRFKSKSFQMPDILF